MFSSPRSKSLSILVAFAALASVAVGSGTRVGFKDAFATGRGNAFVATADNPSALYYNPAGITQLAGQQISSTLYFVQIQSDYRSPTGRTASLDKSFTLVPQIYYTFTPAESSWSFGLGVYAPFGLESEWPDSAFRTVTTKAKEEFITIAPTIAYRMSAALSVAGSITYNRLNVDLRRGIGFVPGDQFRYDGKDSAIAFNLGLLWKPSPEHSFGLSYQHRTTFNTKGVADTAPFIPGGESASARFEFPEVLIIGYSFRPTPDWNIEFNLDWTNWGRRNTLVVNKPSGAIAVPFDLKSGFLYEFGLTRYFAGGMHASLGYVFTEDSSPDHTYNPAIPDSDRHFFSVGVGYKSAQWQVDAAYQHAFAVERTARGTPASLIGETADGRYRNPIDGVAISLGYRF